MKRIIPWLTALCLPMLIGAGVLDLGAAPAPSGWDPDVVYSGLNQTPNWTNDGFEALPDFERDSAKFLVLSGPSNNTLSGFSEGRTQLLLNFPADRARHRVALFDPNTEGLWDQRADGKILLQRPTVHYYLFADGGDGIRTEVASALASAAYDPGRALPLTPALSTALVRQLSSEDVRTADNEWCGFVDVEPQAAALRPDGSYQYFFVAIIGVLNPPPAPSTPAFEGTEACGYKIAFNGTYLLPAGSVIGFGGGVIDKRTLVGSQDTLILSSYDPLALDGNPAGGQPIQDRQPPFTENPALPKNAYDGKFNFHFHSSQPVCNNADIQYYEADGDWNRTISSGDANTSIGTEPDGTQILRDDAPTGLPADNGLRYKRTLLGSPDFPYRDSTPYRMGTQVRWFAFPITGGLHDAIDPGSLPVGTPLFSSNSDAPGGHASVDVSFQSSITGNGGGDPLTENGTFQKTVFPKSTIEGAPGLWCIRWDGVDQGNFIFLKAQIDIGTTPLTCDGELRGHVFCDNNGDCIFNQGDEPIRNPATGLPTSIQVRITPTNPAGTPVVVNTDANTGAWSFAPAPFGEYSVEVVPGQPALANLVVSCPTKVDVELTEKTPDLVITGIDLGYGCPVEVRGRVWCDDNEDGLYGSEETAFSGWTIDAFRLVNNVPEAAPVATVQSGLDGTYNFGNQLVSGEYRIAIRYPDAPATDGTTPLSPLFQDVTLVAGGSPAIVNFTYLCPTSVQGRVWCDDDEDGIYDAGETTFGGLTVEARLTSNLNGPAVASVTTAADGTYTFGNQLNIGSYRISIVYPNAPITDGTSPLSPLFQDVVLTLENTPQIVNFTFNCPVTVTGRVWCDDNANGIYDAGETTFGGMTVEARPSTNLAGPAVASTSTLANGTYTFGDQLSAGSYRISLVYPNSPITDGTTPLSPLFQDVTLTVGGAPTVVNFTLECPVSVRGRVWCDDDKDGVFDAGESPFPGMTVEARPSTNLNGPAVATATTGADGTYTFGDQLSAGSYRISIVYPNPPITDGTSPLSAQFQDVTLTVGGAPTVVNFTYNCPGSIRGRVYCTNICPVGDYDPNSTGDRPLPGILVELVQNNVVIATDTTDANGFYSFGDLVPGTYLIRINGQPTPGTDEIITGPFPTTRTVQLADRQEITGQDFGYCCQIQRFCDIYGIVFCDEDCDGQRVDGEPGIQGIRVILRDDQGQLLAETTTDAAGAFSFLRLSGGTYNVEVDETTLPAKARLLTTNPFQVICDGDNLRHDVEFAVCKLGDICGTVFEDPKGDCDGILNPGDRPVPGVTVLLKNAAGQTLDSRVTDQNGEYCFLDLEPGTYVVEVQEPYDQTRILTLVTDQSVTVELEPSEVETVDFGLCAQDVCGRVWRDEDCDQKFEPGDGDRGIGNIEVTIVGIAGTALDLAYTATTTTDADGRYCFIDVPPGQLEVRVADSVGNQTLLVDLEPQDPTFYTPDVQVGEVVDGLDFIYCPECEPSKICVKVFGERKDECDGKYDETDLGLEYVQVFIGHPGGDYIKWAFTDKDGKVCFEGLEPGMYEVYVGANQRILEGWELCSENCVKVTLGKCECRELEFCYCEKCPEIECCEGNLHEVVIDALIWVGDARKYEIEATLFAGCETDKVKGEAAVSFMRNMGFPGTTTGANGVMSIEDVQAHRDGYVVVTLRITANQPAFRHGHFGDIKRRLLLRVNDCYHEGCMRWRCETMKDGVIFGEGDDCDCLPFDCTTWNEEWAVCQFGTFYSGDCGRPFVVRDVTNYATWRSCNPCEPTYEKKDFTVCFPIGDPDMDHVLRAKIKAGGKVIDSLTLRWTGHSWEGELKGDAGVLKIGRVWHKEETCEMCASFCVYYQCGCPTPDYDLPTKVRFEADLHEAPVSRKLILECEDAQRAP